MRSGGCTFENHYTTLHQSAHLAFNGQQSTSVGLEQMSIGLHAIGGNFDPFASHSLTVMHGTVANIVPRLRSEIGDPASSDHIREE